MENGHISKGQETELEEREKLKLPGDWNVPESLKPRKAQTAEEKIAAEDEALAYISRHIEKEKARKRGGRR